VIIAHDIGTTADKASLHDVTGQMIATATSAYPVDFGAGGRAEQDPELWWRAVVATTTELLDRSGVAPSAIEAVGLMAEDRRDVGLLAVTSADRLNAGWTAAQRARERGLVHARSQIERLLADVPPHCGLVSVLDGHPATLAWLGAVAGHRTRALGVEHFGQTGSLADLYRHYGIDANAIVAAAQAIAPGRPIRHLKALP